MNVLSWLRQFQNYFNVGIFYSLKWYFCALESIIMQFYFTDHMVIQLLLRGESSVGDILANYFLY